MDKRSRQSQPKHTSCPLCHSNNIEFKFIGLDRMYNKPGEFPVYQCNACSLYFLGTVLSLSELADYYPKTYYAYDSGEATVVRRSFLKRLERSFRDRVEQTILSNYLGYPQLSSGSFVFDVLAYSKRQKYVQYPRYVKSGRLLDVGCGGGAYLQQMSLLNWNVEGVELSHDGCEACRARGVNVYEGTLEQAKLSDSSFDFVRFEHVLEHVPDPVSTLKEAGRIIKPGGSIRVVVPNVNSLPARMYGSYWYHLDTPRHLFWFSSETIQLLAKEADLKVVECYIAVDYSDLVDSLIYWLKDHYPALGRVVAKRKTLWKILNKMSFPIRWWMKFSGSGSHLVLTLQKSDG